MAKLRDDEISLSDIEEYLKDSSDFGFEIRILKLLSGLGFTAQHGGIYQDPITNKNREFDIRAEKEFAGKKISIAVECKNLRRN